MSDAEIALVVVAAALGYVLIAGITFALADLYTDWYREVGCVFAAVFWPFILPALAAAQATRYVVLSVRERKGTIPVARGVYRRGGS